ncbi:ABC transporter substrate-binding protein [Hwanghaeella sp.]|uniref:ABC transporter substrate-binding protein n=1 Tax=Hwanghaeella sp. TaxID=2605943 RepID=UPI003CCC403C
MLNRKKLLAAVAVAAVAFATPAMAKTFKWAFQGSLSTLDPHGLNETFLLGTLGNVYEGLVDYDENLKLIPALAESWEIVEPTKWVFKLRKGVKFHEGQDFTADDVIFSWERSGTEGSDQKVRYALISGIKKIDDYTIEVTTPAPNPLMAQDLVFLKIMDKEWSEEHGSVEATNVKGGDEGNYANMNANGTGPFMITENTQDVRTVFKRFDGYWKDIKSNVTESIMTPIAQDATRVAALLSGELDLVFPVPVQDWKRLEDADGVSPLTGPEARTIFLGMDQFRDELLYSNIKGKNPFKDKRVRAAFAHAIDLETIKKRVMRGASTPTGLMVAPQINGFNADLNTPYAFDPEKSKALLAEAGYPDGFEVTMDCPNDRYVNDERICQAVASMLAKVGVKVEVFAQTKSKYFAKVLQQNGYDTSFYLIGWTPGSIDSHNVLSNLIACQNVDAKVGLFNMGNYCNPRVDELTKLVEKETDAAKRQAYIDEAFTILKDDYGYLPLHQQPLSWGTRDGVVVAQRADNVLDFRNVVLP